MNHSFHRTLPPAIPDRPFKDASQKKTAASLVCCRCGCEDPSLFYQNNGVWYCRRCSMFGALPAGTHPPVPRLSVCRHPVKEVIPFALTPYQKNISDQALAHLREGKDVFIYAAAGAGKTEISLASISWFLNHQKKVCFAISRRQVVLEIAGRLQKNYPNLSVVPVCQGYTSITDGDLIVCTMHQLYRYPHCFDLLIEDELDAFPFCGNAMLETIAQESCRGVRLMLSATPDASIEQKVKENKMVMLELFVRPHQKPLCVPKIVYGSSFKLVLYILKKCRQFQKEKKQVLLYVPRIRDGWWMKAVCSLFFKTESIHSKSADKDEIMQRFRDKKLEVLVCTTLLERGITVGNVQVLVYRADHPVFTTASLIQIFGRVGRDFHNPYGEGICLVASMSSSIRCALGQLRKMNDACGA